MSTGPLPTAARAGSPAVNAWITNGTRLRIQRMSESGSRPLSCAPPRPSVFTISTTRSFVSSRNTPDGDDARRETVQDLRDGLGRDLARAPGDEVETECVGTEGDGEERVLLGGDATDLDEHPGRGYRTPSDARRTFGPRATPSTAPRRRPARLRARRARLAADRRHPRRLPGAARARDHTRTDRPRATTARVRRVGLRRYRPHRAAAGRGSGARRIRTGTTTWRGSCTSATSS